jgi:hypothetical protein
VGAISGGKCDLSGCALDLHDIVHNLVGGPIPAVVLVRKPHEGRNCHGSLANVLHIAVKFLQYIQNHVLVCGWNIALSQDIQKGFRRVNLAAIF